MPWQFTTNTSTEFQFLANYLSTELMADTNHPQDGLRWLCYDLGHQVPEICFSVFPTLIRTEQYVDVKISTSDMAHHCELQVLRAVSNFHKHESEASSLCI
jgi:hypothetical protein